MSRIGKQIIKLGEGMDLTVDENRQALVKGKGKSLQIPLPENIELKKEGDQVSISRTKEDSKTRSLHGLTRALIQNAVTGVSQGLEQIS